MVYTIRLSVLCLLVIFATLQIVFAQDEVSELHDDYYFGFSQGAYYGLMLAGEEYDVAWCMKSELEYEARSLGSGGEFQQKIESLLTKCRSEYATEK